MSDRLTEGQSLGKGGWLMNPQRSAVLVFQYDGNVVLYRKSDGAVLWATNTNGQKTSRLTASNGNLVLTKEDGGVAWTSAWDADWKWGNGTVILQDDGDLVMRSGDKNTWNTKTYGLRPKADNDHSGWRPLHVLDDPAQVAGDAIHLIPGVDWAGDRLKDFANTAGGKILLVAFTTSAYGAAASVLGAYTAMAPQIASLTFAIPGLAKGDPFAQAWVTEWAERVKKTIEMVGGQAGEEVGKTMLDQIGPAVTKLASDPAFAPLIDQLNKGSVSLSTIAKKLGIREDVAQTAIDAVMQKASKMAMGVIQGFDIGGVTIPDVSARPGLNFDPSTGVEIPLKHVSVNVGLIDFVSSVLTGPIAPRLTKGTASLRPVDSSDPAWVPSANEIAVANAKLAAYQHDHPSAWLLKQEANDKIAAAASAAAANRASMGLSGLPGSLSPAQIKQFASASRLSGYFAKYSALSKKA